MIINLFSDLSVTTPGFFIFTLIILGIYYLAPSKAQNYILLIASYLFCITWDWKFTLILGASSFINYLSALKIDATKSPARIRWLWTGIVINLGMLFFYKYFDQAQVYFFKALFRIGLTNDLFELNLLQPIGISFYTMQAISYLIDVYRRQIPANRDFIEVSLYLAWFPKLLAGPLERAQNFFNQLRTNLEVDNARITESFTHIFIGLCRKLVIANLLIRIIPQSIFTNPGSFNMPDLLFWWVVFAFVIYNDFAGYTSIAIGISGLFGIQLSPNFEQPFFSTGYIDFWNRWHMSLSNWLRDYIYMPVSRAMLRRNPSGRHWPNLMIPSLTTMIVSGIWHGLAPHFILWGFLNGVVQGFERVQKTWRKTTAGQRPAWKIVLNILYTTFVLLVISVPFKFDLFNTLVFWKQLFTMGIPQSLSVYHVLKSLLAIGLSFLIDVIEIRRKNQEGIFYLSHSVQVFLLTAGFLLLFLATRQQIAVPFIYQEF